MLHYILNSKDIPKNANDMMKISRLEEYTGVLPDELLFHDVVFVNDLEIKLIEKRIPNLRYERRKLFLFRDKLIFSDMIGSEDTPLTSPRYIFKNEMNVVRKKFFFELRCGKFKTSVIFFLLFYPKKSLYM